jgi:lipoyl(octanoyl) transferase
VAQSAKWCWAAWLGRIGYRRALDLQMRICASRKLGCEPDVLLLLEHPPTITLGRNGRWHNLLVTDETLVARGVERFESDRGGDITFHGPGQVVGYPILKLEASERDVHRYMRNLEECLIRTLQAFGIESGRDSRYTGVWTSQGKVAAMGVHISRWITRHGFALNVNTDLSYYDLIVPCGIAGKQVTSMERLLARPVSLEEVAGKVAVEFASVFGRDLEWRSGESLLGEFETTRPEPDNSRRMPAVL